MNQTYDKKMVLAAANKTVQDIRATRAELLAEWDSHSLLYRFFGSLVPFSGRGFYECYRNIHEAIAERIAFKATSCDEGGVYLTDDEIDIIKACWLAEETHA